MTRALTLMLLGFLYLMPDGLGAHIDPAHQAELLRSRAIPIVETSDLDPLLDAIENRRLVLLGEATHGTSEFYTWRTRISQRLIAEKGFRFIAVEGDWASCYHLNRYVKGAVTEGETAQAILREFSRWPTWMWANEEVAQLIEWLRAFNKGLPAAEQVGFYGIDVYGQSDSLRKVPQMLSHMAPDLVGPVLDAYACLVPFADDFALYARAAAGGRISCESGARAVVAMLGQAKHFPQADPEIYFALKQHALVVKHAEHHFRAMSVSGPESWNVRADHFYRTTERLLAHHGQSSRGIVWAHNTHIGDARATPMAARNHRNIGQIARERLGASMVYAVGFGTHRGTVMAGRHWGAPAEVMRVPPAKPDSFEDLLHRTGLDRLMVLFDDPEAFAPMDHPIGHRAIGVVYQPAQEGLGNYVPSVVPRRYDAFIYLAETSPVQPLQSLGETIRINGGQ